MKISPIAILAFFFLSLAYFCFAADMQSEVRPEFNDPGGRIVTVESWASVAGWAIAWAVYPNKIIAYSRNDFGNPERLVGEFPIEPSAFNT